MSKLEIIFISKAQIKTMETWRDTIVRQIEGVDPHSRYPPEIFSTMIKTPTSYHDSETSESNFSASRNLTNCLVSISRKARRQRMDS